ncbi:hypothetical protein DFH09DRAFT_1025846 [Mycena vulgaris]|nr:hypothetical protein DFH09DRAFT_1025846 [Mycena vulgaris]
MFSKLVSAVILTALAGRALAFNVTVNKSLFQSQEVLAFTPTPLTASCDSLCKPASAVINDCATNNNVTACFCDAKVTKPLQDCEQCIFDALIAANKPAPDIRAGSNQVLAGWNANCNLTLAVAVNPLTWDGPFVAVFPEPVGIAIAAVGGLLGMSLIYMLCNM